MNLVTIISLSDILNFRRIILLLIIIFYVSCYKKLNTLDSKKKYQSSTNQLIDSVFIVDRLYDLQSEELVVTGTLKFEKEGKLINGKIIGKNGKIIVNGTKQVFEGVQMLGTWNMKDAFLGWFTDGKDPVANFIALCNLIEMDVVAVLDRMYPIAMPNNNEYYSTNKSIRLRGNDRKNSGLILMTKHTLSNAYFRSIKGNNIYMKNMTMVTEDYLNKKRPTGYNYHFGWSYYSSFDRISKPHMEYFIIDSCEILGAITFRYSSSSQNTTPREMLETGIDSIVVLNSKIEDSVSLLELSNGRYDLTRIENNIIKNIYGPVFYFPLGDLVHPYSPTELSALRKSFVFKKNHVYNDILVRSYGEGYMSSFVVKGAEIIIVDNVFENLLNDNDDIETVPFYTSALNNTEILNNKVTNCIGRGYKKEVGGSNCFIRMRGSRNVYIKGNKFELNKKALFSLGLLQNEKNDISDIDKTRFRFSLWSANLNNSDFDAEYVFEDNIFSISVLTDHSLMSRSKIVFAKNIIDINYLVDSHKDNWINSGEIQNGCLILLRDKTLMGSLLFKDNIISVHKSDSPVFTFTKDINDNKSFDHIIYQNNQFNFNGDISLALPRSKTIECNNRLNGRGAISYNETTTNNAERTIGKLNATSVIENYRASITALIHPKFNGSTTLIAENNADSIINLMNIRFQDVYTNTDLKNEPILIEIDAEYVLRNKTKINEDYQLVIGDYSNLFFINKSDKIDQTFPFWTIRIPKYRYISSQSDGRLSKFPLVITSTFRDQSIDNNSFLIISNTKEIASFNVNIKIADNKTAQRNASRLWNHVSTLSK